jgi:hypothetical protein
MATYNTTAGSANRILGSRSGVPTFLDSADSLDLDYAGVAYTLSSSFDLGGAGGFTFTGSTFDLDPTGDFTLTPASSTTAFVIKDPTDTRSMFTVDTSTTAITFGNSTDDPAISFLSTTTAVDFDSGISIADAKAITGDGALTVAAGAGDDLTLKLGDAAGSNSLIIADSTGTPTGTSINSDGLVTAASMGVTGSLTVTGDLTVNGTTTTVDSETVTIGDNLIVLNSGPSYPVDVVDAGYMVQRYQIANGTGSGDVIQDTPSTTGVAGAVTATTIVLTGAGGSDDDYNGQWLEITSGTGAGNVVLVTDYTAAGEIATVAAWQTTEPVATDGWALYDRPYMALYWNEVTASWILGSTTSDPGTSPISNTDYLDLIVGTLSPTDGLFLADDIPLKLGNTAAAPDAQIVWDSASSALAFISDYSAFTGYVTLTGLSGPLVVPSGQSAFYMATERDASTDATAVGFNNEYSNASGDPLGSGESFQVNRATINPNASDDANSDIYAYYATTDPSTGRTTAFYVDPDFDKGIENNSTLDQNGTSDFSGDVTVSGSAITTFSSTGAITQTGAGQVTLNGNIDATNGLDVTNAVLSADTGITMSAGAASFTGTTFSSTMTSTTTFQVPTNTANTFRVWDGTDDYIAITSATGTEAITFGDADVDQDINFVTGGPIAQTGGGQVSFDGNVDATNGLDVTTAALTAAAGLTVSAGATSLTGTTLNTTMTGATDMTIADNSATAFLLDDGDGLDYIQVDTTTGSEVITIGDAGDSIDVTFAGSGTTTFNTSVSMAGGMSFPDNVALTFGTGSDFTVQHTPEDTIFDNTNTTGATYFDLGANTAATNLAVRSNAGTTHFNVSGLGDVAVSRWTELNQNGTTGDDTGLFYTRTQAANDGGTGDVVSNGATLTDTAASYTGVSTPSTKLMLTNGSVSDNFYNGWWVKVPRKPRSVAPGRRRPSAACGRVLAARPS